MLTYSCIDYLPLPEGVCFILALLSSVIGNDPNVQCRIDYLPLPEGACFILALLSSVIGNDPNVNCRISSLNGNSM